jgi:alkylation response protein AidB-like acyl-CoA dehydrogenase
MHFAFTDEQDMLRDAVRGALTRELGPDAVRAQLEHGSPEAARELSVCQGWTGVGVPEEAGGQGGGLVELAILFEEHGRAAGPDVLLATLGVADALLAAVGGPAGVEPDTPEDEAARGLRAALAEGEQIVVLAAPVPGRLTFDTITAHVDHGGSAVTGAIELVLGAAGAGVLLVPVRQAGEVVLLAVDAADATIAPVSVCDLARPLATVTFDAAPARRVGGPLTADALAAVADRAAVLVAADALGAGRRMLDMTVEYAGQREQFGVVIGSFQAVKHGLADILVDLEAAHSAVYHAAWAVETGDPDATRYAAVAHWCAAGAGARTGDRALALHGAVGFTWEHDLHFPLKRARADATLFSDEAEQLGRIADQLGLPRRTDRVFAAV